MGRGGLRKAIEGEKRGKRWRNDMERSNELLLFIIVFVYHKFYNETVFSHSVGRDRWG